MSSNNIIGCLSQLHWINACGSPHPNRVSSLGKKDNARVIFFSFSLFNSACSVLSNQIALFSVFLRNWLFLNGLAPSKRQDVHNGFLGQEFCCIQDKCSPGSTRNSFTVESRPRIFILRCETFQVNKKRRSNISFIIKCIFCFHWFSPDSFLVVEVWIECLKNSTGRIMDSVERKIVNEAQIFKNDYFKFGDLGINASAWCTIC